MSILYLDLETEQSRDPEVLARVTAKVKPPGQYKKPESIAQWWAGEGATAKLEAVQATALDGTYGTIATIGYAIDDRDPVVIQQSTEQFALALFYDMFESHYIDQVVVFNAEFDLRFLKQRSVVNGVSQSRTFPSHPRHDKMYDPMAEWAGYRGYIKQAELERVLGFSRVDPLVNGGADVGMAIDAGDWASVVAHNTQDILGLRHIHKRMTFT